MTWFVSKNFISSPSSLGLNFWGWKSSFALNWNTFLSVFFAIPGNVRRTVETRATIPISKMVQLRWTIIFPNWEIDAMLLRNNTALLIFIFFFQFLISQVNKFNDFWKKKNISTFLITRLMIVIMKIYIKYD